MNATGRPECSYITWDGAYALAASLAKKIRLSGYSPDMIVAIARGGVVPARILCDLFLIKDLAVLKVEHWGIAARKDRKARLRWKLPVNVRGKKVLVVDDVADTGDSLILTSEHIRNKNPADLKTAVLHYKKCSAFEPDFWAETQEAWKWIIYPWELFEDIADFALGFVKEKPMTREELVDGLSRMMHIMVREEDVNEVLRLLASRGKIGRVRLKGQTYWRAL